MPQETTYGAFLQVPKSGLFLDLSNGTHEKVNDSKPAKFGNLVSVKEFGDTALFWLRMNIASTDVIYLHSHIC